MARLKSPLLAAGKKAALGALGVVMVFTTPACTAAHHNTPTSSTTVITSDKPTQTPSIDQAQKAWQEIIQAINENPNLTQEEKDGISNINGIETLVKQNAQYIMPVINDVKSRMRELKLQFEPNCDSKLFPKLPKNSQILATNMIGDNTVCFYKVSNFQEAIKKDPMTVVHEILHSTGILLFLGNNYEVNPNGDINSTLEGLNDLFRREYAGEDYNGQHNTYYDRAVITAKILLEVFGTDTIKSAFFSETMDPLTKYAMQQDPSINYDTATTTVHKFINDIELTCKSKNSATLLQDLETMPFLKGQNDNELLNLYINMETGKNLPFKLKAGEIASGVDISYLNPDNPDHMPYHTDVKDTVNVIIRDNNGNEIRTVEVSLPDRAQRNAQHPSMVMPGPVGVLTVGYLKDAATSNVLTRMQAKETQPIQPLIDGIIGRAQKLGIKTLKTDLEILEIQRLEK